MGICGVIFKVNTEALGLFVKFAGVSMGLLLIVWLLALLTPKLAAAVDRLMGKKPADAPCPERVEDNITAENYEVHGFFENVPILPKGEGTDGEDAAHTER